MRIIVVEMQAAIDAAGTVQSFYLCNQAFTTNAASTPAHTNFDPTVIDPGEIDLNVFSNGMTTGASQLSVGEILVENVDGLYDAWLGYSFAGRPITIRYADTDEVGQDPDYPGDFTTLFTGVTDTVVGDQTQLAIRIKDKQSTFDVPFLTDVYAGTNVGSAGFEGLPGDIQGKIKPRVLGYVENASPDPVNTSTLIYRVSKYAISGLTVRDRGAALTLGTDYATADALAAAVVGAGTYATCLNEGLFRLGATPAGQITCSAFEGIRESLTLWTRNLDNAAWTKGGLAVTADSRLDPTNVFQSADTLTAAAGASAKKISQSITLASANTVTLSAYVRATASATHAILSLQGSANNYVSAVFNLLTGTFSQASTGSASGTGSAASITDAGGGWWLISTRAKVSVANPTAVLALVNNPTGNTFNTTGDVSWTAAGTETLHAWEFRADPGYSATPWPETAFPSLEENLLLQSSTLTSATWTKTNCAASAIGGVNPLSGGFDRLTVSSAVVGSITQAAITGLVVGRMYTASVWIRGDASMPSVRLKESGGLFTVNYDAVARTITSITGTTVVASRVDLADATWARVWVAFVATSTSFTYLFEAGAPATLPGIVDIAGFQFNRGWMPCIYSETKAATFSHNYGYVGAFLLRLAISSGVSFDQVHMADFLAIDNDQFSHVLYGFGLFVGDASTYLEVMDRICSGLRVYFGFDLSGALRGGIWSDPVSATPSAYYDENYVGDDYQLQEARDVPIPVWRVILNYGKNETPQATDLASSVSALDRAFYAREWRSTYQEDTSIKKKHLLAGVLEFNTIGIDGAYANLVLALYKVSRQSIEFALPLAASSLGDVVNLTLSRFGLSGGKNMRIQRIRLELKSGTTRLTVWG